ncbi:MAG: hypothetical protein MJ240_02365 [Kiritimatiellae bacterium]|nr:hypothetical protein [Kiritimatiellia bacterium]
MPKAGFILPMAIILTSVCAISLAAVLSYVSFTTRMTQVHLGNTQCRLAAQSAIETAKEAVFKAFYSYTTSGNGTIKIGLINGNSFEDWFGNSTTPRNTIGTGNTTVTIGSTNFNNSIFGAVSVTSCFWRVYHPSGASWAIVTIRATAGRANPGGPSSSSTIEERVRFALMRSRVFDNAYFVNNYGWFQGSGITANGDVRANGNLYLDSSCTVNGRVYAARNDELGVIGSIQNKGTYASSLSAYWSNCGNRARPSSPTYNGGSFFNGGYSVPTSAADRLYPYQEIQTMPYISALDEYVTYAQEANGKLSGGLRYSINSQGTVASVNNQTINAHYNGAGPSGNTSLADKGALVLEGTQSNPIVIDGPVVVDSDVVIKGYVKGQGTIYSGRNIHIVGDIKYVNAPTWPHPDTNPTATAAANNKKDLLGLAAKGNIVMGDYTLSSAWLGSTSSGLQYYLKTGPYVQQYVCDESDKNIGYPRTKAYGYTRDETKFCGDYTQADGGSKVAISTSQQYVTVNGRRQLQTVASLSNSKTRKYYESVCPDKIINTLCSDTASGSTYTPKITQIDAVLYNNHGILGHIGNCTINGSLVCRNEAMIYSGALKINWDHRLFSGASDSLSDQLGLPMDASQPPITLSWREISTAD